MDEYESDQHLSPEPDTAAQAPADAPAKSPAYGSILGIILIVAVLVAGAFYIWNKRIQTETRIVPENGVRGDTFVPDSSLDGSVDGSLKLDGTDSGA